MFYVLKLFSNCKYLMYLFIFVINIRYFVMIFSWMIIFGYILEILILGLEL